MSWPWAVWNWLTGTVEETVEQCVWPLDCELPDAMESSIAQTTMLAAVVVPVLECRIVPVPQLVSMPVPMESEVT